MIASNNKTREINTSINKFLEPYRELYSYDSFNTMKSRLKTTMRELHQLGYGVTNISRVKPKHVEKLVTSWKEKALSIGTIKNRMSDLRFVCRKAGRESVINDNNFYGIGGRPKKPQINRAITNIDLNKIHDPYLKSSIRLQKAFGLRREECLKIIPSIADYGDHLRLKGSWTKGNIERTIFIRTEEQRKALNYARIIAGWDRSLIPQDKSYIRQRHLYNQVARDLGQSNLHGLRYAFAQRLYKECTGWECPFNGGKNRKMMSDAEKRIDKDARELISLELGHSRLEITKTYLG